jgi:hypothetical protein
MQTYDELRSTIADWANRKDLGAQIPTFINIAEQELFNTVRIREMERTVRRAVFNEFGFIFPPIDVLELKWVQFNGNGEAWMLQRLAYDQMAELAPVSGDPVYFAERQRGTDPADYFEPDSGNRVQRLYVWPNPGATELDENGRALESTPSLDICYYAKPESLSADVQTNTLFKAQPYLYLWGALRQVESFLKVPLPQREFEGRYATELGAVLEKQRQSDYAGATLRQAGGWA